MEIVAEKLVYNKFELDYLEKNCSPTILKKEGIRWCDNTYHQYSEDISNSDIVISIQDIANGTEYGYYFFTKKPHNDIFVYELVKAIFDSDLPEEFIRNETDYVLTTLVNGNYLRNDRLFIGGNNLPFYGTHIENTKTQAAELILRGFKSKRDGIVPLTEEQEKRLKERADK